MGTSLFQLSPEEMQEVRKAIHAIELAEKITKLEQREKTIIDLENKTKMQ